MIPVQRDLEQARDILSQWLQEVLPEAKRVALQTPTLFPSGYSAELLGCHAEWESAGEPCADDFVVRVEPSSDYQLFLDTNFYEQYRVQEALDHATSVPVPNMVGFENDATVLGQRFYVMRKMPGRTAQISDPWMLELGAEGRETLWWNGLEAMASLHRADWLSLDLGLLSHVDRGTTPMDQQLSYYAEYYDWSREGKSHPVIEAAAWWLQANKPEGLPISISWGDARRGNQLFTPDLRCAAMLDFEQVSVGHAEFDFAWWLVAERRMAQVAGVQLPDRALTEARYSEALGRPVEHVGYFEVFAAYRIAVLHIKLRRLLEGIPGNTHRPTGELTLKELLRTNTDLDPIP